MTVHVDSERFLRPSEPDRVRRNYRRIQMQRLLALARNFVIVMAVLVASIALVRRTQSDARFAVRHVEITGAVHSDRDQVNRLAERYVGMNLFRLDIGVVRHDLASLLWVSRVEVEKKLPDTLRIHVVERTPVALAQDDGHGRVSYVDEQGIAFAEVSPAVGDADFPLIVGARGKDMARCIEVLRRLRQHEPELYARISEVRPLPPHGFAFFDRRLGTFVYASGEDFPAKWRDLTAIGRAENFTRGDIVYADLRFADRIFLKPAHAIGVTAGTPRLIAPAQITN
jgi:cell division septal protein FtsQ